MEFPIKNVSELEQLSATVRWQYFEKLVAFIFEENGFDSKQNVIVKEPPHKRQFDVIAKRYSLTYLVECKKWKSRREKTAALKSAVAKHLERCALYEAALLEKALAENKEKGIPLIVTLLEEDITEHEGVLIVPIMKLNWFLNNFDVI
jgi:hypothetical protein